jgi:CheY-like chemotaxis protein
VGIQLGGEEKLGMSLAPASRPRPSRAPRIDGGPLILIVDDDRDSRDAARMVLEDEGYTVDVAADGRAALDRLNQGPAPMLLLVDLTMPVMDGPSLLSALESSAHAKIPVVVMTATGPDPKTSTLPYPVLRKPFDLDDLIQIVTVCAPRLWDEDEEPTDETFIPSQLLGPPRRAEGEDTTARARCVACDAVAAMRCTSCGEAFCRRCLNAGPSGRCPSCRVAPRR